MFLVVMYVGFLSFVGLIALGIIFLPTLSLGWKIILAIATIVTFVATTFAVVKFGKKEAEERAGESDVDQIFKQHVRPYLQPKQGRLADVIRANLETGLSHGITEIDLLVGNAIAVAECNFSQMTVLFCDSPLTMEDIEESIHKAAVYVNEHFALRSTEEYEQMLHQIATNQDTWKPT